MTTLKFSDNWNNKLFSKVAFTTIRSWQIAKVGEIVNVELHGKRFGRASVMDVKKTKLNQINDWVMYLDAGCDKVTGESVIKKLMKTNEDSENITVYLHLLMWFEKY